MTPMIEKAVVAVLLPREHLPFIRQWCRHHLDIGWKVFLYDNTGSQGSLRATSSFQSGNFQRRNIDKRGNPYGKFTEGMSDGEVRTAFEKEVAGLGVEVVVWQPRDCLGRIVHGQVEAYVHFIRNHGDRFAWAAFIDADEYLHCANGLFWDRLLEEVEVRGYHRLMIEGIIHESRWTPEGNPRVLEELACCGKQVAGQKNIVRPAMTVMADIHWGWRMEGSNRYATVDPTQFHFRHYKGDAAELCLTIHQPPSLRAESESLPVSPDRDTIEKASVTAVSGWRISAGLENFLRTGLSEALASPSRILELGPGYSTLVLSESFPEASVTSVEHDESWFGKQHACLALLPNVELVLAPLDPESRWYGFDPAGSPPFDLLLVDGPPGWIGTRVREKATVLARFLSPGAWVILNNTDRRDEAASVGAWQRMNLEVVGSHDGFTVLRVPARSLEEATADPS